MKKFRTLLFSSVPLLLTLGIQTALLFYLLFIATIFLYGVAPVITGAHYDITELFYLIQRMDFMEVFYIIYSVCNIIIFGMWYTKRCGGQLKPTLKGSFHPLELLGIAFLIPGTQYMSSILTSAISLVFPSWLEAYEELMETAGIGDDISLLMMFYTIILAPIAEELIFRGVTLRVAYRVFPFWIANFIQAFLFGVFHQNMLQGCYTFILGLFIGYICEKGSLFHAIFFHFLFNLWGIIVAQWLIVENEMLQGIIILGGTVLGLTLGFFLFEKGNHKKHTL